MYLNIFSKCILVYRVYRYSVLCAYYAGSEFDSKLIIWIFPRFELNVMGVGSRAAQAKLWRAARPQQCPGGARRAGELSALK